MVEDNETGTVTFVPTNHVSRESSNRVEEVITTEKPDIVAVELDEKRADKMVNGGKELDNQDRIVQITNQYPMESWLFMVLFSEFQSHSRQINDLNIDEGDMPHAINVAKKYEIDYALIDQSAKTTVTNFFDNVGFVEAATLHIGLLQNNAMAKIGEFIKTHIGQEKISSMRDSFVQEIEQISNDSDLDINTESNDLFLTPEKLNEEQLEQIKENVMRPFMPEFVSAFLDDRDKIMASRVNKLIENGNDVVVVIGAAHLSGMKDKVNGDYKVVN